MVIATVGDFASDNRRVAVLIPGPVRFFDVQLEAMQAEAEDRGLELTVFDAAWDASRQVDQLAQAADLGFDLLAIAAVDSSIATIAGSITSASDTPVITFTNSIGSNATTPAPGVIAHVGRDEAEAGRLLGTQVSNLAIPRARVLVIEGAPGTSPQRERRRGFVEVADDAGWQIVETVAIDGWDLDLVESTMARHFEAGRFDVVATQWADSAVVVSNYLESVDADPFPVVTLEWTESLVHEFDAGHIRSSSYFSIADEGAKAIETAAAILAGDEVPSFIEVEQVVVERAQAGDHVTEW